MTILKVSIPLVAIFLVACNETRVNESSLSQEYQSGDQASIAIEPDSTRIEPIAGVGTQEKQDIGQQQIVTEKTHEAENKSVIGLQAPQNPVEVTSARKMTIATPSQPLIITNNNVISEHLYFVQDNRENYDSGEISSIKLTSINPVSTFSTDVDTASYTNARRYLSQGTLPPAQSVRVEEFINYFEYRLRSPKQINSPLSIETELMQTPWNSHTKLMRVSLQAYRSSMDELPPLNLVFLLDVSGSMQAADKLPLMQRSFNLLVNQMRPQDHISIVVYAGASGVVLEPTAGTYKSDINAAINQLRAGGSTHGSAGIHLAYQMAQKHFLQEGINRVILGTDGDFNVGTTNLDSLKDLIARKRDSGVFLNVLGFGTGNYNDHLMEELSNQGNGVAYYIDSYQEARKIFSEQLTATLQTVAKDVKIQVEFNPAQIAEYRLIGYDNRQLHQEDFNNDKIDAGEMGSGHTVTALYEIVPTDSEYRFNDPLRYQAADKSETNINNEVAFVKVRYKLPQSEISELINQPIVHVMETSKESGSETMQLSAAVAGFAELLRNSPYVNDFGFEQVASMINKTKSDDRWGYRSELLQLVKNAQSASFN